MGSHLNKSDYHGVCNQTCFVSNECGNNSVVECQLPKLKVASSNLVSRSNKIKDLADFG